MVTPTLAPRPRLALVSTGIRRDLLAPLKYFTRFELIHLYHKIEYGDLTPQDLEHDLVHYSTPFELYRCLVESRPDIIQGVEPLSVYQQPQLWACWLAARHMPARLVVVSLENRPLGVKFNPIFAALLRTSVKLVLSSACLAIALNRGAQDNLRSCDADPRRMVKLLWGTWGVDLDEFSPIRFEDHESPTILYAGRLVPEKGIFVLLDAFRQVTEQLPNARLLVAGGGDAGQAFQERLLELGLKDAVQLLGTVKNREMPELFRRADVVAVPSLTTRKWAEQVGMVALQAMATGVPVIASKSGALPEFVPDGVAGLLVPENNSMALADALLRVLTDRPLQMRLSAGAREYACRQYDARANIAHAEQVLYDYGCASRI